MVQIRLGAKQPITVAPGATVQTAVHEMRERNVGAAAVVEDGRLVGILTERDVLRRVVGENRDPASARVAEVMTSPAISIELHTSIADAADIMRRNHIRHLPVLDADSRVMGILALRYVLYDMLDDLERNAGDLLGYIMADGLGG
jgi:CBS domain-containing protein